MSNIQTRPTAASAAVPTPAIPSRIEAHPEKTAVATGSTETPPSPLAQNDRATATVRPQDMTHAQAAVQDNLTPPSFDANDLQRLLKTPAQRLQLQRVLQQQPQLAEAFTRHEGGAETLALLKKPRLSAEETRTVQRFLSQHADTSLAYPGHATGIDGQYGKRTHQAVLNLLSQELGSNTAPAKAVYQGLGAELNALDPEALTAFKEKYPRMDALLQKPRLTKTEVLQLQQALVDAGENLSYRGHPTGVDGDFGKRSKAALANVIASVKTSAQTPVEPPAEPAPVSPAEPSPDTQSPEVQFSAQEALPKLARKAQTLPAETLAKLPAGVQEGLKAAAAGSLSKSAARDLQQALVDMGQKLNYPGHPTGVDGAPGQRTRQALANVLNAAVSGETAAVTKSGPFPQYDSMLDDGLLDMTMAIGYDEGTEKYASAHLREQYKMLGQLADRGYVRNDARARELLKEAGHDLKADYTAFYVKENVAEKDGKPVHALVRVIHAGDGTQGAQKRAAAIESMNQSDVFMYGGHARYGTGMDFDRNFTVTIDWNGVENAPDTGKVTYKDYGALKKLLGGNAGGNQWLQKLEAQGKITINGSNDGNIRMSEKDLHRAEFGSRLMNKALEGVENTLSEEITGDRHRLWLFNGCRTSDYMASIHAESRSNVQLKGEKLDVITTEQTLYWHNISDSLMSFLDGVTAADGTPDLNQRLQSANPEQADRATHAMNGFQDNPQP